MTQSTWGIRRPELHTAWRCTMSSRFQLWPCKKTSAFGPRMQPRAEILLDQPVSCQPSQLAHDDDVGRKLFPAAHVSPLCPRRQGHLSAQVPAADLGAGSQRRAADTINLQRFSAVKLHLCRPRGTCSHAGKSDPSVA